VFGENRVIGSVSFGGTRTFQLRHKTRTGERRGVELTHGSLLVMRGATQHHWVHRVPKTARAVSERLNLTFRVIRKPD
jgi:alkylated DNA repair dioxygenase AlkB